MQNSEQILIATDLDGTLLDDTSRVSDSNITAIASAKRLGISVIAATARSPQSTSKLSKIAGLGPIAVCANGAIGWDLEGDRPIWHETLDADLLVDLIAKLRIAVPDVRFAREFGVSFQPEIDFFERVISGLTLDTPVPRLNYSHLTPGTTKLILRSRTVTQSLLGEILDQLNGGSFAVAYGSIDWVEVLPAGVNKATGLAKAADHLGISHSKIAAVGDHLNDLEMIAFAEIGAAVENAHPALLSICDVIVPSNQRHGVGTFITDVATGVFKSFT